MHSHPGLNPTQHAHSNPPRINLALQGGGSHGAFTWGVLDTLLDDGRVEFEGISGTSAGAMNAVAMAHGFAEAEGQSALAMRESARISLAAFWEGIVEMGAVTASITQAQRAPFDALFGGFGGLTGDQSPVKIMGDAMTNFWSQTVSPYQSNPLDINPLRSFLEGLIDFDRVAAYQALKVFVVATTVSTGKAEIFCGKRLTAKAVMASACLPMVFRAVEIDGEHYWDGGYAGNPAIHPLIYRCDSRDVVLVQINPIKRDKLPTTAAEIMDRVNEITFNAALMAEMRAIDFVKRLLVEGKLDPARYKNVLMHRIDGGEILGGFHASTKAATDAKLIHTLRDLGKDCAKQWLAAKFPSLGVASTVDIGRDYLDAMRVPGQ
ncbi:MAG: patatin-like phospholipase family protein [Pseudomonadota bacterium]